jgi:hypothetical protein
MINIARGNQVNAKPGHEVVRARCEQVISRAGDGVREGCDHRDEQEAKHSEGGTGGDRRPGATVPHLPGRPERPLEPRGIEDSQAVKYGSDQNPHAIAVVESASGSADGGRR